MPTLLLCAARAWLFPVIGPGIDNEIGWIVAFALAGTLFVIPTAGEVPIIQAMLSLGVAAGPAIRIMEDAAIAHQQPALRRRDDLAVGRHPVLQRHRSLRAAFVASA